MSMIVPPSGGGGAADHGDLGDVLAGQHHARYADIEALATQGIFDVTEYGAVGDDSTDDITAINAALAALRAAGRGILYFPQTASSIYRVSAVIDVQTVANKPDIIVRCDPGVVIAPSADIVVFSVKQDDDQSAFNADGIAPYCYFERVEVEPVTPGEGTAFLIEDSYGVIFGSVKSIKCAVGLHMQTYNSWTEGWVFEDVLIDRCTVGLKFVKKGGGSPAGTGSFQAGHARKLHIRGGMPSLEQGTGAILANCKFDAIQIWVEATEGAAGLYLDGNLDRSEWFGLLEAQGAAAGANRFAIEIGANATFLTRCRMGIAWDAGGGWAGGEEYSGAVKNASGIEWRYMPPPGGARIAPSTIFSTTGDSDWADTPFDADIAGAPNATTVVYDGDSGEDSLGAGQVLHNTTKSQKVLIASANRGTNTITVVADSPDNAGDWEDDDVITTASVVNTGRTGVFVDIDVTAAVTREGSAGIFQLNAKELPGGAGGGQYIIMHPWTAYDAGKETLKVEMLTSWIYSMGILPLHWDGARCYVTVCVLGDAAPPHTRSDCNFVGQM